MRIERRPEVYDLRITLLSPLHIGTGNILRKDFDYVVERGRTWIIDNTAFAEEIYNRGDDSREWQRLVDGAAAGTLLNPQDFRLDSPLFRYVLRGAPDAQSLGAELHEMIKTPYDEPYIPGSSLKGALRTAFMFVAFKQLNKQVELHKWDKRPKFAAQALEHEIAGKDPNHDIFRALQVADSHPIHRESLAVVNARVYAGNKLQSPIPLEVVLPDATFETTLTLDKSLLEIYPQELGWDREKQVKWLGAVATCANALSGPRIATQFEYWKEQPALRSFYQTLAKKFEQKTKGVFFLQLGWGGGWDSKTFGEHLRADERVFADLTKSYNLLRKGSYKSGQTFPKSRRVVIQNDHPQLPLGWIEVHMERRN